MFRWYCHFFVIETIMLPTVDNDIVWCIEHLKRTDWYLFIFSLYSQNRRRQVLVSFGCKCKGQVLTCKFLQATTRKDKLWQEKASPSNLLTLVIKLFFNVSIIVHKKENSNAAATVKLKNWKTRLVVVLTSRVVAAVMVYHNNQQRLIEK